MTVKQASSNPEAGAFLPANGADRLDQAGPMQVRLRERLQRSETTKAMGATTPESTLEQAPAATSILIVDDDPSIRWTITAFLQTEGYRVQTAANGARALECIEQELPSLILLDMNMPVLNGQELMDELRARNLNVPVVVMTAAKDARQAAEQIGASAYVVKPVSFPMLLGRIDQFCA